MEEQKENTTPASGVSRRGVFQILGAVPVVAGAAFARTPAAYAHVAAAPETAKGPYQWKVFTEQQQKTVRVLSDLIIPADDRSGSASQAGVPEFMDDWLNFRTEQDGNERTQSEILGGLTWIDRESNTLFNKDFADASVDQQKQILDRIAWLNKAAKEDVPWATFFSHFRSLTVGGFFSSKMGVADLPYLGNTAVAEWKGCDPEVWAVVEGRLKNGYQSVVKPGNIPTHQRRHGA